MLHFTAVQHQRGRRQWHAIVGRLSPSWNDKSTLQSGDLTARLIAFRDAGVVMEALDYVERNAIEFDRSMLAEIRSVAIHARISILLPVSQS